MSPELKRTLRTVVQILIFAAGALPSVVEASGIPMYSGVVVSLAVAAGVARLMQAPAVQPVLRWLGLDVTATPAVVVHAPAVTITAQPAIKVEAHDDQAPAA